MQQTKISGELKTGKFECFFLNGYWNKESAEKFANKRFSGRVILEHEDIDTSGHGRSWVAKRWIYKTT